MKWIVEIDNDKNKRIMVLFKPLDEKMIFNGQYKTKNQWVNFSLIEDSIYIKLNDIQKNLFECYEKMKLRSSTYDDLNNSFGYIKNIEIIDNIDDNQAYGVE